MALTLISGTRDTSNINSSRLVIDMSNEIAQLQPNATPFTVLLKKLAKKKTIAAKFEWLEDELLPRWDLSTTGCAASEVHVPVDNHAYFTIGDIVKVPSTGECMLVSAIEDEADTITVTRGFGETATAIIAAGSDLVILGNANEEGATAPTAKTTKEEAKYNYTQIFRTPFGATETEKNSELYGGNDIAYQRKKKGIEHMLDIERALLFGELKQLTTGTHPRRTTRGLLKFISTNATTGVGALTLADFEDWLKTGFAYGSDTKVLFASGTLLSAISQLAGLRLQTVPSDTTYGISVKEYISPFGKVNIVFHRLLEEYYDGTGVLVDLANVKYRFLEGRDTKLKTNIQANDEDSEKDEYLTECGLEVGLEKTHALISGVTGIV
jgi:hypothetical protein